MQNRLALTFLALLLSHLMIAQEIKTKVQESGFDVKPELVKEEQFDPANFFAFVGGGVGIRTGEVLTGFLASGDAQHPELHKSNDDDKSLRTGFSLDLGLRYFFDTNFGIGLRSNAFFNKVDFVELNSLETTETSSANTRIGSGNLEGIYRLYFSKSKKEGFGYGGIGLGFSLINQEQNYRGGRKTDVNQAFFMARPFVGVNIPIWDRIHFYGETGYQFSQGEISDGTLSLSQLGITVGVHIRLNDF